MTRFTKITLAAAAVAMVFTVTQAAQAGGCGKRYGGHHRGHYYHPPVRVVHRPVHVHRPAHVHRPVVVHPAPVVAPAPIPAPTPRLTAVPVGSTITLPGNFLGPQPGQAFLVMGQVKLPLQIGNWTAGGVTVTLPPMGLAKETPAAIAIVLPDGRLANNVKVLLVAPAKVIVHEGGVAAGPAPTASAPIQIHGQQTAMAGLPFGK